MDLIKQCLTTKYADFSGRARRKEYWLFVLFIFCIGIVTALTTLISEWFAFLQLAVNLLIIIPTIAVYIRRLHDTDHSGWWILIGLIPIIGMIVLLYFLVIKGTEGSNRFGADPLE